MSTGSGDQENPPSASEHESSDEELGEQPSEEDAASTPTRTIQVVAPRPDGGETAQTRTTTKTERKVSPVPVKPKDKRRLWTDRLAKNLTSRVLERVNPKRKSMLNRKVRQLYGNIHTERHIQTALWFHVAGKFANKYLVLHSF